MLTEEEDKADSNAWDVEASVSLYSDCRCPCSLFFFYPVAVVVIVVVAVVVVVGEVEAEEEQGSDWYGCYDSEPDNDTS